MLKYRLYKIMRMFHLISKKKYKKRVRPYLELMAPDYRLIAKSKLFDSKWYLEHNPDVKATGVDPVLHYLNCGWKEDRDCTPYFDGKKYLEKYPDVAASHINPLLHWEKYGKAEGRDCVENGEKCFLKIVMPSWWDKLYHCFIHPKPFISIVVASYNYENYIAETLNSLFKQTYKSYEIIIVDDGSSDHSVQVIKKTIRNRINAFLYQHPNKENRGLPKTVELAVSKAKGDYIAFCEADDFWSPHHLEEKVAVIRKYANPKIIVNQVETFGDCVREAKIKKVLTAIYSRIHSTKMRVLYEQIRQYQYIPTFSCCMVKTNVLRKCDFSAGGRPSALDWWLWRQILPKCSLYYLPQKLTYWRIHNSYNASQHIDFKINQPEFDAKSDALFYGHKNFPASHHKTADMLQHSSLFDAKWYMRTYKTVGEVNPCLHYLYKGWLLGYNPSLHFNGNKYLDFYTDVKEAQVNPLFHYLKFGITTRFYIDDTYKGADVLILTTVSPTDGAYMWRCLFMKKFIERHLSCSVLVESLVNPDKDLLSKLFSAKLVIFNRPHNKGLSMRIIQFLQKHHHPVMIDLDDLLMEKYQYCAGRFKSGLISWNSLSDNMFMQESCLVGFDKISVSTKCLSSIHTATDKNVFLYRNKIDEAVIPSVHKVFSSRLRLLYASGSATHDCDFMDIYIDLLNFMLKYKNVDLTILGETAASFNLPEMKDRVLKLPMVTYAEMLDIYAKHDLLLVPLDDNLFNRCKSNIKYIEAAAVKTPVLAKNLDEFGSVIRDGVNGFLYNNDFYAKLENIYKQQHVLPKVGYNAYVDCIKYRTIQNADECKEFLEQIREVVYAEQ